tara:strand:+ start:108574 stop:108825 length:252 start_codon:yes stop_codon:yes gene_type:complete
MNLEMRVKIPLRLYFIRMIIKFPKLLVGDKKKMRTWFERQRHRVLAEHHTYAAHGNDSEAARNKSFADCLNFIKMMMEFHEEE